MGIERNLLHNEISQISNSISPGAGNNIPATRISGGVIHYVEIGVGNLKFPHSGVFIPTPLNALSKEVDIIVYWHGLIIPACSGNSVSYANSGMKSYLENNKFFDGICPAIADSGKKVVLVALSWLTKTTKGKTSYDGGQLFRRTISGIDFNLLVDSCISSISELLQAKTLQVKNIVLAAHSAGGAPMQRIVERVGTDNDQNYLSRIKECWGFDSQYGASGSGWIRWLESKNNRVYKHFSVGNPSLKGYSIKRFKQKYPKRTVPPVMQISNIWSSLAKNKKISPSAYVFSGSKVSHCAIVKANFRSCLDSSETLLN